MLKRRSWSGTALREAGAGSLEAGVAAGREDSGSREEAGAAKTGSAQAKAMEHPIVQQAQTLFNAEIQNVIDLREND